MTYSAEYLRWRESDLLTEAQRQELQSLTDENEIEDRFYRALSFGTSGLRGVMGMGLNRMNEYVIRQAADAFARVILERGQAEKGVCICFDCRHNSRFFAEEAAHVMRARGIPVYLFQSCRPTPQLSFAVRHFDAAAGINVTASHNPKDYNGFKAYWQGGFPLNDEQAGWVAEQMAKLDPLSPRPECEQPASLTLLDEAFDAPYIEAVLQSAIAPEHLRQEGFKVVYSAFHGVGGAIVPQVLKQAGLQALIPVPEQFAPDGDFPTLISPNPEDPRGFDRAIALAEQENADLVLGTDPDSDRVAIAARGQDGRFVPISGNRTGALLTHYLLTVGKEKGKLPPHPALVKTIVTSPLPRIIAEANGCLCRDTFTGFKYLAAEAERLNRETEYRYLLAFEESIGYMIGDHARDKDGVVGALLLCEMAGWYRSRGMTVLDGLEALWREYGCFSEVTRSVMLPGQDGMERMAAIMAGLRKTPLTEIGGTAVRAWRDYGCGLRYEGSAASPMELSGSNVVYYELESGEALVVRPSGTEPKIKIYALMQGENQADADRRAESCALDAEARILAIR